jgi:hypothetical protein
VVVDQKSQHAGSVRKALTGQGALLDTSMDIAPRAEDPTAPKIPGHAPSVWSRVFDSDQAARPHGPVARLLSLRKICPLPSNLRCGRRRPLQVDRRDPQRSGTNDARSFAESTETDRAELVAERSVEALSRKPTCLVVSISHNWDVRA